jgi:RHS repeat-associated protein
MNNASGAPLTNRISAYTYDAAGNVTNDGGAYTYDAASRMKTAGGTNYGFDGDGRRVRVQQGGYSSIYYLWSSVLGQPVAEIVGDTGNLFQAYVYGPGGGQMVALLSNDGTFYWNHPDHLGSGRKLTDSTGAVRYRGEFDPHGQVVLEVTSGGTGTYANSHKYTGYEREWSTNLDYAKARMYNHNRARFMQPDPLGLAAASLDYPQSLNLYSYVFNDPANFTDPTGLFLPAPRPIQDTGGPLISGGCYSVLLDGIEIGTFCPGGGGGGGAGIGETGGGGGNAIDTNLGSEERKKRCKSLERAIRSHAKQAQRHIDNYGPSMPWFSDKPPYNPLTGQMGDYQDHLNEITKLTAQYIAECSDFGPPPPVPAFQEMPKVFKPYSPVRPGVKGPFGPVVNPRSYPGIARRAFSPLTSEEVIRGAAATALVILSILIFRTPVPVP